jgi:hypothetical protein
MRQSILLGVIVLSLAVVNTAEAGQITDLQLDDGTSASPVVTVYYTNTDGSGSSAAYTYADPQVSGGTTDPMFYCVDLWHDNYLGSTYTITRVPSLAFGTTTFSDVDNRIGWLLTQDQSSIDARAAMQLALWYTVDDVHNPQLAGFSFTGGDPAVRSLYDQFIRFAGYNPQINYAADFWAASHDSSNTLYQDLVSARPLTGGGVAEPGSIVLADMGLAFLIGAGLGRRRGRGVE